MALLTTQALHIEVEPRDWPRCDRCDMPVQSFCIYDAPDALYIEAQCHGRYEVVRVPNEVTASMLGSYFNVEHVFGEEI